MGVGEGRDEMSKKDGRVCYGKIERGMKERSMG